MRERSNTCCFTGHRDISAMTYAELNKQLEAVVPRLIERGIRYFVCGGALGFDTLAAVEILRAARFDADIKLILALPCRDQTAKWGEYDKRVYDALLSYADEVIWLAERYYTGCMQKRNRAMVDASACCICYLHSDKRSGTLQTVEYARASGLPVVNVFRV